MSVFRDRFCLVLTTIASLTLIAACVQAEPPSEMATAASDGEEASPSAAVNAAAPIEETQAIQPATPPPAPRTPAPPARVEPPAPTFSVVNVPAGTEIEVELLDPLSSGTSQAGDHFTAQLVYDLVSDGRRVAAAGAEVRGTVTETVPLKNFGGQPKIALAFDSLQTADGETVPLTASLVQEGAKQAARDAAKIGGGAAAGAVIGHQVDDDKGKAIGALLGGAIGTAVAAKTGKEVELPAGTSIVVVLESGVQVRME